MYYTPMVPKVNRSSRVVKGISLQFKTDQGHN